MKNLNRPADLTTVNHRGILRPKSQGFAWLFTIALLFTIFGCGGPSEEEQFIMAHKAVEQALTKASQSSKCVALLQDIQRQQSLIVQAERSAQRFARRPTFGGLLGLDFLQRQSNEAGAYAILAEAEKSRQRLADLEHAYNKHLYTGAWKALSRKDRKRIQKYLPEFATKVKAFFAEKSKK
jgi:cell division septum initiation protein DivIVA